MHSKPAADAAGSVARASWRELVAVLSGAGVAWGGLSYVALTIGVLAEGYHCTLTQAAAYATLELAAMAVATMTGGYALRRVSVRTLAVAGGVVAGLANVLTATTHGPLALGVLRVIVGLGFGWMAAGLNTALSVAPDAERLFIRANFGCITAAALFFELMPKIYGFAGYPSYFVAYGIVCLGTAAVLGWLPVAPVPAAAVTGHAQPRELQCFGMFIAVSLLWLCYAAVWSLTERLGRDIGMTEESVGHALSLGTLAGLLGAGVAAWFAGRVRPLGPLLFTSLTTGLCYVWFGYSASAVSYVWVLCVWGVVFCPILAYAYAVATAIDPTGRLGRLIGGGTAISTALGPVVGAQLQQALGYHRVGFITFAGTLFACLAIGVLARPTLRARVVTATV